MTDSPETILDSRSTPQQDALAGEKRQRWFELSLVLLVAVGGFVLSGIYLLKSGPRAATDAPALRWVGGTLHEITALMLLGYVLSRRKLRFSYLGFGWAGRDFRIGAVIVILSYLAYVLAAYAIQAFQSAILQSSSAGPTARDYFPQLGFVAVPFFLLNPFFEELIVRAYLMAEVADLTGSRAVAVVASVAVQFSYHLYYGWAGALSLFFPLLVFALFYAKTRRVVPVIFAHGFFDILMLIRLW